MLSLGLLALAALGAGPASSSEAPMSAAPAGEICDAPTASEALFSGPQVSTLRLVHAERPAAAPRGDWCVDNGDGTDPRCGAAPGSDRPVTHTSANPGTHHAPVVTPAHLTWPSARSAPPPTPDLGPLGAPDLDRLDRPPRA